LLDDKDPIFPDLSREEREQENGRESGRKIEEIGRLSLVDGQMVGECTA
jgi:hypothetical protein